MFRTRQHLSDRELLLSADGELSGRRLERAHRHLATCPTCQVRLDVVLRTLDELARAWRDREDAPLPPVDRARARLEIELARLSRQRQPSPIALYCHRIFGPRRWLYAFGVVVLSAAGSFMYARTADYASDETSNAPRTLLLPIADLTPGATRPVTLTELCSGSRHASTVITIPASLHQEVFRNYGADHRRADEYELDHLITPELGGISDARNLWPQPYGHTPWNAYVKDELERLFHRLTCAGEMDLATAQRQIAMDWISAYKHHFKTEKPLRDYARDPLTALDADLLLSELEEFGVSPLPGRTTDGRALMRMLQTARDKSLRVWLGAEHRPRDSVLLPGMVATTSALRPPVQ